MNYEDGLLPVDKAKALLAILVAEQPGSVLEIGTYMGHTTRLKAENLPQTTIHTVDLPEEVRPEPTMEAPGLQRDDYHLIQRRVVGREFQGQPCASRIRQHFARYRNLGLQRSRPADVLLHRRQPSL
jgi:hypothetical protein